MNFILLFPSYLFSFVVLLFVKDVLLSYREAKFSALRKFAYKKELVYMCTFALCC